MQERKIDCGVCKVRGVVGCVFVFVFVGGGRLERVRG